MSRAKRTSLEYRFRTIRSITPLYAADNLRYYWNHCWYCGIETVYVGKHAQPKKPNHLTRDHVHPASQGGKRGSNTVPACVACNKLKMDLSLDEFRLVFYGGHGGLFFGERREKELEEIAKKKQMRPTLFVQLQKVIGLPKPVVIPKKEKCLPCLELMYKTPLITILSRFLPPWHL